MNNFEGRTLKPLTYDEIKELPDTEKPNYRGEDSLGKYIVDGYGIKRREGERGGPLAERPPLVTERSESPQPKVAKIQKKTLKSFLANKPRWKDPGEILLAIANGDKEFFNNSRLNKDTKVEDIPLFMRMDAAKQLLPYLYSKPVSILETEETVEEKAHRPQVMVILGSNGHELVKPENRGYNGLEDNQEEI
jgi:hypothetical protein